MKLFRTLMASTLVAGSLWTLGCTQTQPASNNTPAPPPKPSASAPSPAASAVVASPSAAPSAAAASPMAAPSSAASTSAASPTAAASTAAGGEKAPPPVGMKRLEYEAAGIEISVPENMPKFQSISKGEWLGSATPDDKMAVLVRSKEWKEWPEVIDATSDLITDLKAEGDPKEAKTSDGIKYYYTVGTATLDKKPHYVFIAGYELSDHDFVLVIVGSAEDKSWIPTADKIVESVTRQEKYNNGGGEKSE